MVLQWLAKLASFETHWNFLHMDIRPTIYADKCMCA